MRVKPVAVATERAMTPPMLTALLAGVVFAGAVSTAGHVWMLLAHAHGTGLTVVMALMTLWCAVCTVELWIRPSPHCLRRLCLMSLAMVFTHAVLVAGVPGVGIIGGIGGTSGHTHHAGGSPGALSLAPSTDHASGMLALIAVELAVALTAGFALRQIHRFPDKNHPKHPRICLKLDDSVLARSESPPTSRIGND